jgi:trk system potassium uptake protein TrkH
VLCHSFGSVATGGFSTRNASIRAFHSPAIETTIIGLMVLGGTNFTLYYYLIARQFRLVLANREFRLYITLLVLAAVLVSFWLRGKPSSYSPTSAVRYASFQVVSIMTATGFSTDDFERWPAVAKALLLVLMFVSGCVGSTAGGVKVLRCLLVVRVLKLEILRAFRPQMVRPLRVGAETIDPDVRHDVVVYVAVVGAVAVVAWLALLATQPEDLWYNYAREGVQPARPMIDCAAAVATCMNGVGPGLGLVGPARNFGDLNALGKLLLSSLMVLGRLEYFPLLVLFQPSFWKIH